MGLTESGQGLGGMSDAESGMTGIPALTEVHTSALAEVMVEPTIPTSMVFDKAQRESYLKYASDVRVLTYFLRHTDWWNTEHPRKITQAEINLVAEEIGDEVERGAFLERISLIQENARNDQKERDELFQRQPGLEKVLGKGEPFEKKINPLSANRLKTGLLIFEIPVTYRLMDYRNPFTRIANQMVGERMLTQARESLVYFYERTTDGKLFRFMKGRGDGETINMDPPIRDIARIILGDDYNLLAYRVAEMSAVLTRKKSKGKDYPKDDFPPELKVTDSEAAASLAMGSLAEIIIKNIPLHQLISAGTKPIDNETIKRLETDLGYRETGDYKTKGTFFRPPMTQEDRVALISKLYIYPPYFDYPILITSENRNLGKIVDIQPIDVETGLPILDDPVRDCLYTHTITDIEEVFATFDRYGYEQSDVIKQGAVVRRDDHFIIWSKFATFPIKVYFDDVSMSDSQLVDVTGKTINTNYDIAAQFDISRLLMGANSITWERLAMKEPSDRSVPIFAVDYVPGQEIESISMEDRKLITTLVSIILKSIDHGPIDFLEEVMLERYMGKRCYDIYRNLPEFMQSRGRRPMDIIENGEQVSNSELGSWSANINPFLEVRKVRRDSSDPRYKHLKSVGNSDATMF